jgi:eukaryotic-like serine/threonine-protein kinase
MHARQLRLAFRLPPTANVRNKVDNLVRRLSCRVARQTVPDLSGAVFCLVHQCFAANSGDKLRFRVDIHWENLRNDLASLQVSLADGSSVQCIRLHGEGQQAWVYQAQLSRSVTNPTESQMVALKVLRPDTIDETSLVRFRREAKVLRTLTGNGSRNIARFLDHFSITFQANTKGADEPIRLPCTLMEWVAGPTLADVLKRDEALPLALVVRIVADIASALREAHAHNVIHRDLKPSNVLFSHDSFDHSECLAKVADFGLAKVLAVDVERTKTVAGASLSYAPPEQYERGNQRVGAHTDIFALAAIAFELLTRRRAFPVSTGENPLAVLTRILSGRRPALTPDLSPTLQEDQRTKLNVALQCALAADPAARFPSIDEFFRAFIESL